MIHMVTPADLFDLSACKKKQIQVLLCASIFVQNINCEDLYIIIVVVVHVQCMYVHDRYKHGSV